MKLKDLKNKPLSGVKVKTPKGVIGYWKSQWEKGVWLTQKPTSTKVYPQFVDDLRDCLEWEVTEEDSNCHKLFDLKSIDMKTKKN